MQLFQALLVHVIEVLYCMHLAQLRVVCLKKVRGLGEMDRDWWVARRVAERHL